MATAPPADDGENGEHTAAEQDTPYVRLPADPNQDPCEWIAII